MVSSFIASSIYLEPHFLITLDCMKHMASKFIPRSTFEALDFKLQLNQREQMFFQHSPSHLSLHSQLRQVKWKQTRLIALSTLLQWQYNLISPECCSVATCFWTFKKLQPICRLEESTLISSRLDHKEGLHMWTKKQIAQDCKYKHLHPQKHNPPSISAATKMLIGGASYSH